MRRVVAFLAVLAACLGCTSPALASGTETPCVYASGHISQLDQFDALTGRDFRCVMIFADASPTWQTWDTPGALLSNSTYLDFEWGSWESQVASARQIVMTLNMFPSSENSDPNVLAEGAAGDFDQYATTLAQNLVAAGYGNIIIRLGHEANGTWYPDSIPNTTAGDANWVQFWRNIVLTMRAVPGAHFRFDWCVNAGVRDIPLTNWYPGDDVVDIIGVDAYDTGVPTGTTDRWDYLYNEPDGIGAVAAFAAAHGKPLSIPEWGLGPAAQPGKGYGGDDPAYVNGIASIVQSDNVAYESYFWSGLQQLQLDNSPLSLAAYINHFGPDGDAVGEPSTSSLPSVAITGGYEDGSQVPVGEVEFTFAASGGNVECSLDGQPFRACSTSTSDIVSVAAGFHYWRVQVSNANNQVDLVGRTLTAS